MSYKYRVLSLQERGHLLLIAVILILIGGMFLGTAILLNRFFPGMASSVDFGLVGIDQSFPPGSAVFASLAGLCLIIALAVLGTAIFSDLAFLYIAIILVCLLMVGLFIKSFIATLAEDSLVYDLAVFGILAFQLAGITFLFIKLLNRFDAPSAVDSYSGFLDKYRKP